MAIKFKDADGKEHEIPDGDDIAKMVTGAVTSHTKTLGETLTKSLGTLVKDGLGESMKAFEARVDEKIAAGKPKDPPKEKPAQDPETAKLLKDMADRLTKAEEETKAEKAARVAIENQRIQDGARGALRGALADLVNPLYLDDAMTRLDVIEKRLKTDDKGNPILTVKRAPYKGAPEEDVELSLDEAIPLLVQSKDMARYLLPPGGQGGDGQRGGSHQQRKAPGNTGAMPSSPVVKPGMSDAEKNAAVLSALQASGADMSMFEG